MDTLNTNALLQRTAELESELAAKNRELEIEAALEKVRSRSLAMHHSEELKDVVDVMFKTHAELKVFHGTVALQLFDFETKDSSFWPGNTLQEEPPLVKLPFDESIMNEDTCHRDLWQAMISGEAIFNKVYTRKQKDRWFRYVFEHNDLTTISSESRQFILKAETHTVCFIPQKNSALFADSWDGSLFSEDEFRVLERTAKVFEQAYIRFLDLQKAEAAAREGQIEAALERVRSRTMAMQKSDELQDAAALLFKHIRSLGALSFACGFAIWDDDWKASTLWMAQESIIQPPFKANSSEDVFFHFYEAAKRGDPLYVETQEGEGLIEHYRYMATIPVFKRIMEDIERNGLSVPTFQILHCAFFSQGFLLFITYQPVPELHNVFQRFAKVFEQTYTRFLDLQRAEAHAREAQIEAAMERLRARAMMMQASDELAAVVKTMYTELKKLDESLNRCFIMIFDEQTGGVTWWMAGDDEALTEQAYRIPYSNHPPQLAYLKGWKERQEKWLYMMEGNEKKEWDEFLFNETELSGLPAIVIQSMKSFEKIFLCASFNNFGCLTTGSVEPLSSQSFDILVRFSKVFDLSYTRFLDLQQAEAQAREARIEAALERVRSRSMAMQKSAEVMDVAVSLYDELQKLDFTFGETSAATIIIMDEKTGNMEHWLAGFLQKNHVESYQVNNSELPLHAAQLAAWREGKKFVSIEMSGSALKSYAKEMFTQSGYKNLPDEEKAMLLENEHAFFNMAYMSHGALMWAPSPLSDESAIVLQRFAKVFEQTYTRFLDLQKAEAQAREATIEAALEKIRSRSLAMHHSNELTSVISVMFEKLKDLKVLLGTVAIWLFDKATMDSTFWVGNEWQQPAEVHLPYDAQLMKEDTNYKDSWQAWLTGESYINKEYSKEQIERYFEYVFAHNNLVAIPPAAREMLMQAQKYIACLLVEKNSALYFDCWDGATYNEEHIHVLKRVAKVFEQAYVRFLDLQKAEAQAREAQIQLALERIRSRSLAMHHSNELKDVVGILFQQLKILGLEFDGGAAIHLFTENSKDATIIVAAPNLASPIENKLPYDEEAFVNNPIILDVWNAKETGNNIFNRFYSSVEKNKYFAYVFKHNSLEILPQATRDSILQADSYTASFIAEKHSLLGANSWTRQQFSETDFEILKRIAKVFEQAYIRFIDLQKAEALAVRAERNLIEIKAARKKAEETLIELKATQAQLIQSEKMASLGELTAGIAHEIQNPLNFVNNFSEVNKELIEELKSEKSKVKEERDEGLEDGILNDISSNLEKISHHGKRADSIVKGMMQHSQVSTGLKETTDINALADEYLRLSFHGIRAKDKSFNATIKTDFDKNIGKINIVPQDIGRVLLNLYNNAFYAVSERKQQQPNDYEPTVLVSTKKINDKPDSYRVEIRVKDNGNGIPQNIVDKIFQPFFTTKPTGQGTGLGLSLSYDVIKAHGGEIGVETKEGESAEVIIRLPSNN